MSTIRVMHFGLGPIGSAIAKQIAARPGFKIVGGIDVDPAKIGRDLGDVVGLSGRLRLKVQDDPAKALKAAEPDVVVHCTSSSIREVMPQLETILKAKTAIVSTTEELSYPGYTHIRQARLIHALGEEGEGGGARRLASTRGSRWTRCRSSLTAVCERVERVTVTRIQDARLRRLPFQQKIGAGLTTEQFQRKVAQAAVRHVGMTESIAMIADALGWTIDRISDEVQPKAGDGDHLERVPRRRSRLCLRASFRTASAIAKIEPAIRLHFEAYLGAPDPCDAVEIEGSPSAIDEDSPAAFTATSRPRPWSSIRSPRCWAAGRVYTRCATCRSRRSFREMRY